MRNALGAFLLTIGAALALPAAAQPARIAVSCDGAGAEPPDLLCPILIETLDETAPGATLFVPDDGATPAALHLRLETSLAGTHMLRGRLVWRHSPDGPQTAGPEVTLTVLDSGLTEAAIRNFARALAKVSELPIAE